MYTYVKILSLSLILRSLNKKAMLLQGYRTMLLFALSHYTLSLLHFHKLYDPALNTTFNFDSILRRRHISIILLVCRKWMI